MDTDGTVRLSTTLFSAEALYDEYFVQGMKGLILNSSLILYPVMMVIVSAPVVEK